jgi:Nitrogen regulatory protein P-II
VDEQKVEEQLENLMIQKVPMKRVVIIGDETVEYRIVKEIHDLGATGYTYYLVHGEGAGGERPRHGEPGNAKIEVICTPELAERILEHIAQHYFANYAIIAFLDDVEVIRGEKFGLKPSAQQ